MPNQTKAVNSKKVTSREELVVAFEKFHTVVKAKVSNLRDRQTHAFGKTEDIAQKNALRNYRKKYSLVIS